MQKFISPEYRFLGNGIEFFLPSGSTAGGGNLFFIKTLSDLPDPVSGVITLEPNATYFIIPESGTLDLLGNRIETSGHTTILGGSSETSYITSAGLNTGIPLITSLWTLALNNITIKDVNTALNISGLLNGPVALDWNGVNFLNVPEIGLIQAVENFIFTKGSFLNSKNIIFDGGIFTVAFNNSLFSGDGLSGDLIKINPNCQIIRRFRIIYSSIISFASTNGVNVDPSAIIPNQGFILDTCAFTGRTAGAPQYLPGVTYTDNKALFVNNTGIKNSAEISQYYMRGNVTPTIIPNPGDIEKVAGTTTSAAVTQKFTNTNNRATYNGTVTRFFSVTATASLNSGNNHQIGLYIAKNGTPLTESETYTTTNGSGRAESATVQTLVELANNDYIEIFVENSTAGTAVTVTELNVVII